MGCRWSRADRGEMLGGGGGGRGGGGRGGGEGGGVGIGRDEERQFHGPAVVRRVPERRIWTYVSHGGNVAPGRPQVKASILKIA